jgi:hypothetical protein
MVNGARIAFFPDVGVNEAFADELFIGYFGDHQLARGEKADEILHTEQMRMKQMREMKMDLIKSLINYKIN